MMQNLTILRNELAGAASVAIAAHIRPDGDAVGSSLGMYLYLKEIFPGLRIDVYLEEIPEKFRILQGLEAVCAEASEQVYDVFLSLDCSDKERLGQSASVFDRAKKTICFDHHISNHGFADLNYIYPDASSTSEVIHSFMEEEHITKACAEALYLGIVHDTGVFRHSCTSPETMETAAGLMRKGINISRIISDTFYDKTFCQNRILGKALIDSRLLLDGKVNIGVITLEDMDLYGVSSSDLDGIVPALMGTVGVEAAIFLYEKEPKIFKVSLRSRSIVDVSAIASGFGGGGHVRAAGCTMEGEVPEILDRIVPLMEQQLNYCSHRDQ